MSRYARGVYDCCWSADRGVPWRSNLLMSRYARGAYDFCPSGECLIHRAVRELMVLQSASC